MRTVSLAEGKATLGKIIDDVEAGVTIEITRYGKPVARVTPVAAHKRIDIAALRALTASMQRQEQNAGDFVRMMRDGDRA